MLAACRRCRAEAVMLYRCDCLTRSLHLPANTLCAFEALGIQFISLREGVDTSTPKGRLVFGLFAGIAEFERELIRGRVRSRLTVARARSKRLGRPPSGVDA